MEEFGPLCEVQSDKAAVEITSRYTGTIARLHHQAGDMVQVREAGCPHSLCSSVRGDAHGGLPAAGVSCNPDLAANPLGERFRRCTHVLPSLPALPILASLTGVPCLCGQL